MSLDGERIPSHAATLKRFTWGGNNLLGATATCRLTSGEARVTLTNGSGMTNTTDTATSQVFEMLLTAANKATLLGDRPSISVSYEASITVGGTAVTKDESSAYVGSFTLIDEVPAPAS